MHIKYTVQHGFNNVYNLCNVPFNQDLEYLLLTKFLENGDLYMQSVNRF